MTDDAAKSDYSKKDLRRIGEDWLAKIKASEDREETWIKNATKAEAAYLADDTEAPDGVPSFNILHSNVETIVPSIYNSSPTPDIRPRHNQRDPISKVVSDILERAIETQVDDSQLDFEVEASAQDSFLAGRGVVRVRFDADEVPAQTEVMQLPDPLTGELTELEVEVAPAGIAKERVIYEVVSWRDYREGPAMRWRDVPWVSYRHKITEKERERLENEDYRDKDADKVDEDQDVTVWEIWCKETMKVYFIVDETGAVLDIIDDPLELTDFFPQGKPVQPITATGKRTPVCPYVIYEKLARELDQATKRINKIMEGLKVRGIIAGDAEIAELVGNLGDNELVPVANLENLAATGGLDKAVMWWPVEQSIKVLQQLYVQREQTKQAIYEITGISDIIRGQSSAQETATAQNIKTQWGALRIKKMQRLIERQVRDLFVLSAEIISKHFSQATLQHMTGIKIPPEAAQLLSKAMDHYRIDVESDSTVRADLTRMRGEMSEFLQGTAQFFATMQPVVQAAPSAAGPLAKMYRAFARQFSLGKSAEDAIEEFVTMAEEAGKQPDTPDPAQEAMKADMQMKAQAAQGAQMKAQADAQMKAQELQMKGQEAMARLKLDQAEAEQENKRKWAEITQKAEEMAQKIALAREELELKRTDIALRSRDSDISVQFKGQELDLKRQQNETAQKPGQELAGLTDQIKAGHAELSGLIQQGNEAILRTMTAPRKLIRDDNGRPVGVQIETEETETD